MRPISMTLVLIVFFAIAATAQTTAPSVFTYRYAKNGGEAQTAAVRLETQIGIGLMKQFPCVDQMDLDSVAAILDVERKRQLLTGEANDALIQNIASSLGAKYLIVINAVPMGNGQTFLSVKVLDTVKARSVANRVGTPASGDDLFAAIDSLARQILDDISALLKGSCTPHWSGTVTFDFKYESKEDKTETFPGGDKSANTRSYHSLWRTENLIQAMLNSPAGDDPNQSKAIVVHRFTHRDEHIVNEDLASWCRPKQGNSFWKRLGNKQSEIGDEQGEARSTETIWINIDKTNGTYKISVKYPAVKTKSHREITATGVSCFDAKPSSAVSDGEESPESSAYIVSGIDEIYGELDPKNPDMLVGKKVTGDETGGVLTVTWNLRRVKPRPSR